MLRPAITIRRVTPELEGDFTALCTAAHLEASGDLAAPITPETRVASEVRVAGALARDGVRALLAIVDERPVGYIVLSQRPMSFLVDSPCVSIEQIFVTHEARRSGAARALVSAAATYADRLGAEQIASTVPARGREANRFFARLGFSSYVVRRVTTTAALRRRLAEGDESHPGVDLVLQRRRWLRAQATRSTTLDQVLLRRRSLRARVARSGAVSHLGPASGSGR
ncbi:MAG: GNAT family N-acetyltransferase [Actinomycetota bacterium]